MNGKFEWLKIGVTGVILSWMALSLHTISGDVRVLVEQNNTQGDILADHEMRLRIQEAK